MITIDSKVNKQIAKNLSLEGMEVTKKQQRQILDIVNKKKYLRIDGFSINFENKE
ncbi:hypothetical protein MHJ97_01945 [Macrococcus epidermidis]|uniref:hypothetical protein n=1 Tax=Macrococcus epidermidis TaxID=1902580 RepID=UPI001EF22590|nr:hypothetical protein [Macrococcus epidermidis]MCG7419197.1 hypothetical protein [Macrococcus epidermidis]